MRSSKITGLLCLIAVVLIALSGPSPAVQPEEQSEKINLNTATIDELMELSGIGRSYAGRIIEYRETQGFFSHIEELKNVKGIGDKIFEKNKSRITVEIETSQATEQASP